MIKLCITDLDDTLYSWIGFFIPAFYDMVNELSSILGKDESDLLQEYKKIHQEKGSVEYPYATILLPSVVKAFPNYTKEELIKTLSPAFHRFNNSRMKNLCLFPKVRETLEWIYKTGIIIVGYTESSEENGFYRLEKLNIDALFHKIFVSISQYKKPEYIKISPKIKGVQGRKPNPELLKQICIDENVLTSETIYIGDSLTKDVYMAKMAGIRSIMCKYPKHEKADILYRKLVDISSWTEEDFKTESNLKKKCEIENIKPDYIIESFDEIIQIVEKINMELK